MTLQNSQRGTERGQTNSLSPQERATAKAQPRGRLPWTHQDYWRPRLRKRAFTGRDGASIEIPTWQIRIKHQRREAWFNLDTANQEVAATKARDIYVYLLANGWPAVLAKFKPRSEIVRDICTVGDYLEAVKANSALRQQTFEIYARKFRTLLAGAFGVKDTRAKFDYVNGGHTEWVGRVHRFRLDRITTERVERWKIRYLKQAERENPLAHKHAKTTLNSIIRGSKALFAQDVVDTIKLRLPSPLPMAGVKSVSVERQRYRSKINPHALLLAAKNDLAPADPEPFKIMLLALGAGLRRDEIDNLEWKQIDFARNTIQVETTEHTATKSSDSEGEVDVDPGLLDILKKYLEPGAGSFVIQSENAPRPQTGASYHYRCERHFQRLIDWLRAKGVNTNNPLHTLRKEFGCQIAAQAGIFAASLALRHADIQLTRDYYLDKKQRTAFPISEFLKPVDEQKATEK